MNDKINFFSSALNPKSCFNQCIGAEFVKFWTSSIEEGRAVSKSPPYKFGYFLSMSQQAISADIIPNSAVWERPPARAARVQHMIQLYAATTVQTGFYLPLYAVLFYSAFLWSIYERIVGKYFL